MYASERSASASVPVAPVRLVIGDRVSRGRAGVVEEEEETGRAIDLASAVKREQLSREVIVLGHQLGGCEIPERFRQRRAPHDVDEEQCATGLFHPCMLSLRDGVVELRSEGTCRHRARARIHFFSLSLRRSPSVPIDPRVDCSC